MVYFYLKLSHDLVPCVSLYLEELTCQFGCWPKWCRAEISVMWVDVILWVCVIDFSPPPPHLTHNYFLFGSLMTDLLNFVRPVMIISLGSDPVSGCLGSNVVCWRVVSLKQAASRREREMETVLNKAWRGREKHWESETDRDRGERRRKWRKEHGECQLFASK